VLAGPDQQIALVLLLFVGDGNIGEGEEAIITGDARSGGFKTKFI
jgi:hypothetical protein